MPGRENSSPGISMQHMTEPDLKYPGSCCWHGTCIFHPGSSITAPVFSYHVEAPETSTAGSGLDWIVEVIFRVSQAMAVYFFWITWVIASSLIRWNEAKVTFRRFYCLSTMHSYFKGPSLEKWAALFLFPQELLIIQKKMTVCNDLAPVAADSSSGPRNTAVLYSQTAPWA